MSGPSRHRQGAGISHVGRPPRRPARRRARSARGSRPSALCRVHDETRPHFGDRLLAARGTSSSNSGKNPTGRGGRAHPFGDRCALLPKNYATLPGFVVAPSKKVRNRRMRLDRNIRSEGNVKDKDTGIRMTRRTLLAAAPFVAAAAGLGPERAVAAQNAGESSASGGARHSQPRRALSLIVLSRCWANSAATVAVGPAAGVTTSVVRMHRAETEGRR